MIILDVFVCALLLIAVVSGLWTIQRNHEYFSDFRMIDFFNGRIDGWLYVVNYSSTALCLVDVVLRSTWALSHGWNDLGQWGYLWLGWHAMQALTATALHVVTNILLDRKDFCRLCKRRW